MQFGIFRTVLFIKLIVYHFLLLFPKPAYRQAGEVLAIFSAEGGLPASGGIRLWRRILNFSKRGQGGFLFEKCVAAKLGIKY